MEPVRHSPIAREEVGEDQVFPSISPFQSDLTPFTMSNSLYSIPPPGVRFPCPGNSCMVRTTAKWPGPWRTPWTSGGRGETMWCCNGPMMFRERRPCTRFVASQSPSLWHQGSPQPTPWTRWVPYWRTLASTPKDTSFWIVLGINLLSPSFLKPGSCRRKGRRSWTCILISSEPRTSQRS